MNFKAMIKPTTKEKLNRVAPRFKSRRYNKVSIHLVHEYLMDKHKFYVQVMLFQGTFYAVVRSINTNLSMYTGATFVEYNDALEDGIEYCLKFLLDELG